MRRILSEKNVAALLFVMVIVAFSFAHEDSKKRSVNYNVSSKSLSADKNSNAISAAKTTEKPVEVKQ
jgi:RecB family endonuclease NucS